MSVISMKQLLEAGVHFGHQTRKWNPKMKKYIFTARNDIHILNLEDTEKLANIAYNFIKEKASEGKTVLFVGTKKQAAEAIKEEAERAGAFYINSRWLGGTLTNFKTIRSRVDRLNKLEQMEKIGEFNLLPKKEVLDLKQERDKLLKNLGGIREMRALPGVVFVVDPHTEHLAVREARKLRIPIVGLVDTNCDPDHVDYIIPGNDDAIRAVKLVAGAMADAIIEAREGVAPVKEVKEDISSMEEVLKNLGVAPVGEKKQENKEEKKVVKTQKETDSAPEEKAAPKKVSVKTAEEKAEPVKTTVKKPAVKAETPETTAKKETKPAVKKATK